MKRTTKIKNLALAFGLALGMLAPAQAARPASGKKPDILIIWGDAPPTQQKKGLFSQTMVGG